MRKLAVAVGSGLTLALAPPPTVAGAATGVALRALGVH